MFAVLAVGAIAATLALVSVTSASGTMKRTHRDQRREQAIHLAEAGVARAMTELAAVPTYFTTVAIPPDPVTRTWVLTQGLSAPLMAAREGEYAWIVPQGQDVGFGIGYIPTRANALETRVVKVGISEIRPFGELSFLSAGSATINGNVDIDVGGSIHSNANLSMIGSTQVGGNATSTGTFTKTGSVDVNGDFGGGYAPYDIPVVDPLEHRSRTAYDLCPDGTVKATAPDPCTGTVLGSGILLGWNGWTWSGSDWSINGGSAAEGGFYVYHGNATITGNVELWNGTIVVHGQSVAGVLINGDFTMSGNTEVQPVGHGVAVVASRDIVLSGSGKLNGVLLAGEQVSISGDVRVVGQVLSASPTSSAGSPVSTSSISGSVTITAQIHAPDQTGGFSASSWSEL
jgi:hypothetical protein